MSQFPADEELLQAAQSSARVGLVVLETQRELEAVRANRDSLDKSREQLQRELAESQSNLDNTRIELGDCRTALIDIGRTIGCLLEDEVSTHFLLHVPQEARARFSAVRERAEKAEALMQSVCSRCGEHRLYVIDSRKRCPYCDDWLTIATLTKERDTQAALMREDVEIIGSLNERIAQLEGGAQESN